MWNCLRVTVTYAEHKTSYNNIRYVAGSDNFF